MPLNLRFFLDFLWGKTAEKPYLCLLLKAKIYEGTL